MSVNLNGPWHWRPPHEVWFHTLHATINSWVPNVLLKMDPAPLVNALHQAAIEKESWLLHPCVHSLTAQNGHDWPFRRDLQLAVWIAAHKQLPRIDVSLTEQSWIWSRSGRFAADAGVHDLRELGKRVARDIFYWPIAIDPWGDSAVLDSHNPVVVERPTHCIDLDHAVRVFLRATGAAARLIPECLKWMTDVTKVAIPLPGSAKRSWSASSPTVPGLVWLTVYDELQVLEALVHETAHQHLFFFHAQGPLVDPTHHGYHTSPLRPEPRPLYSVLAAYHAVAYMAAFYADMLTSQRALANRCVRELDFLRPKLEATRETLDLNEKFLTDIGLDFLERTSTVAAYGLRQREAPC